MSISMSMPGSMSSTSLARSRSRTASFPTAKTKSKQRQQQRQQQRFKQRLSRPSTDSSSGIPPHNNTETTENNNIHVYVRCRSRNQREIDEKSSVVISTLGPNGKEVILSSSTVSSSSASSNGSFSLTPKKMYTFDQVFGPEADQELVFEQTAKNYINEMLRGYNCTVFAYGQTGTGKTYTMSGDINILGDLESQDKILLGEHAGIIPRVLVDLFRELSKDEKCDYSVKVSFLELYNERLGDLLDGSNGSGSGSGNGNGNGNNTEETIRIYDNHSSFYRTTTGSNSSNGNSDNNNINNRNGHNASRVKVVTGNAGTATTTTTTTGNDGRHISSYSPIMVKGMEEIYIKSAHEGLKLLTEGSLKRKVASTKCNDLSSRSHTIFTITTNVTKTDPISGEEYVKIGKLNLVDLAGSENITRSGAENKRAQEAGLINKSLLTLGRVINALVDHSQHIPYRESKLTRLLQDSLGGKTKTCIIATISPAKISAEETVSTLEYATRAKSIKNTPQVNQLMPKNSHLSEYVQEIEKLRKELRVSRSKDGIYVTQDQYELFESNELLIKEQKMRMHNMEEQLQKFKNQYVKQTEINKALQLKLDDTELKMGELEKQKKSLVELFGDYELAHDNYLDSVNEIHSKNLQLIHDLNNERNSLVKDVTKFNDVTKQLVDTLTEQSKSITSIRDYWTVYRDKFREVTEGVWTEFEDKVIGFEQNVGESLSAIELNSFKDQVQNFQRAINEQLSLLESVCFRLDENFDKVGTDHKLVLQQCYNDVSSKCQNLETLLQRSLEEISDRWKSAIQNIQLTAQEEFTSTRETIESQRDTIKQLETELQKERKVSQVAQTKLHELETWFNSYVSNERKQLFETLQGAITTFEEKHRVIYDNVLNKTKSTVLDVQSEFEKYNETCVSKVFNGANDAIKNIDQSLYTTDQTLNKQITSVKPELDTYIAKLPLISSLKELQSLLRNKCSESASVSVLSAIETLKQKVLSENSSVQVAIDSFVRKLHDSVTNNVSLHASHIDSISAEIDDILAYITKDYKDNVFQIPKTQSNIVTEKNTELEGIISKINEAKATMVPLIDEREASTCFEIDTGDLKIEQLVPFVKPKSYELIDCLRGSGSSGISSSSGNNSTIGSDSSAPLRSKNAPNGCTSPSQVSFDKSVPSTPVPIPDIPLPLPQVLIPRSVNSSVRKIQYKANSMGPGDFELGKSNSMKRRFTVDTNGSPESKENLGPIETKRLHMCSE